MQNMSTLQYIVLSKMGIITLFNDFGLPYVALYIPVCALSSVLLVRVLVCRLVNGRLSRVIGRGGGVAVVANGEVCGRKSSVCIGFFALFIHYFCLCRL